MELTYAIEKYLGKTQKTSHYLKVDWKKQLTDWGFENFDEHYFYRKIMRLLKAEVGTGK